MRALERIGVIIPQVVVFALSFAVLSVLWINHHFIFHSFARSVDRKLNLFNLGYLMFVAFVPFSAAFIGEYHTHEPAAIVYGINIFAIVFLSSSMVSYIKRHKELLNEHISARLINQARFRSILSLCCYSFGIIFAFVSVPVSVFLYTFPIIFNIIPGTLDLAERIFRFDLGERTET